MFLTSFFPFYYVLSKFKNIYYSEDRVAKIGQIEVIPDIISCLMIIVFGVCIFIIELRQQRQPLSEFGN